MNRLFAVEIKTEKSVEARHVVHVKVREEKMLGGAKVGGVSVPQTVTAVKQETGGFLTALHLDEKRVIVTGDT